MSTYSERVWWAVRPLWYWRLLRMALRSFWLAVTLAVCGWLLSRTLGISLPLIVWGAVGFAAFMVLLPTLVLWPIPASTLTRRLDAVFRLRDTLTTAGEVAEQRPANYVEWQLLRKADATLRGVRRRLLKVRRVPWTDLALSLLAMVVLYACYLLAGTLEPLPLASLPAADYALPPPWKRNAGCPCPACRQS